MAVMARETWTDDRMDDLAQRVDTGFARVDQRFEQVDERFVEVRGEIAALRGSQERLGSELRAEFRSGHDQLRASQDKQGAELRLGDDKLRGEIGELRMGLRQEIRALGERIDRLQMTMIGGFISLIVALVATHSF